MDFQLPGMGEVIVFRSRLGLEDVRRFVETQLRLFYDTHGHGSMMSVETWPWGSDEINDPDQQRKLPSGTLRETYTRTVQHSLARTILVQCASQFCVALVSRGRQDRGHNERDELVTRIFDATLLQDATTGFYGQLESPQREFWILSRNWAENDTKEDLRNNTTIPMSTFYQRWLVHRDMAITQAERRLQARTAHNIERLFANL
jgi:hypothetical protein